LRPAFVKLDRSLMAGIDGDPVRQALIVGMSHFASSQAATAEIPLGQGFLLGTPAPVPAA